MVFDREKNDTEFTCIINGEDSDIPSNSGTLMKKDGLWHMFIDGTSDLIKTSDLILLKNDLDTF